MSDTKHKHTILYAEDDADDLYMVNQAFQQFDSSIRLIHALNGFEALKYLGDLKEADMTPCLIILDVNMPGMDGKETLIRIKQSDDYKTSRLFFLPLLPAMATRPLPGNGAPISSPSPLCIMNWSSWQKLL